MKTRNVGHAITILARAEAREIAMHLDVDIMYAPSECHGLVSKGEEKRLRVARKAARAISGLTKRQFRRHLPRWTDSRWYRRAVAEILLRQYRGA